RGRKASAGIEDGRRTGVAGQHADVERAVQRPLERGDLARIRVADRVEHDEQREQEGEHVGVAHDPALVVLGFRRVRGFAAHAASGWEAPPSVPSALPRADGARKPSSFSRTIRGLSPDWIEVSPSMTSSRFCCSCFALLWTFFASGSQNTFAVNTP